MMVVSSPCYRDMPGEHRVWADLFSALARRNAPEIVKLGTELLAANPAASPDELAYLTTVTALAQVRMGEFAQAGSLLQAQRRRFDSAGQFELPLRELAAITQLPGVGISSGSAAPIRPGISLLSLKSFGRIPPAAAPPVR